LEGISHKGEKEKEKKDTLQTRMGLRIMATINREFGQKNRKRDEDYKWGMGAPDGKKMACLDQAAFRSSEGGGVL